jgi:hypothetical protein
MPHVLARFGAYRSVVERFQFACRMLCGGVSSAFAAVAGCPSRGAVRVSVLFVYSECDPVTTSRAHPGLEDQHRTAVRGRDKAMLPLPECQRLRMFSRVSDKKKKKQQEEKKKMNLRKPAKGVAYGDVSAKSPSFDRHSPTPASSPAIL